MPPSPRKTKSGVNHWPLIVPMCLALVMILFGRDSRETESQLQTQGTIGAMKWMPEHSVPTPEASMSEPSFQEFEAISEPSSREIDATAGAAVAAEPDLGLADIVDATLAAEKSQASVEDSPSKVFTVVIERQ